MKGGSSTARGGRNFNGPSIAAVLLLLVTLAPGCSRVTTGDVRSPGDVLQHNWVEWVTDPESNSFQPKFIAVVLRGDGDFSVGLDFPPGTYESQGGRGGRTCSWSLTGPNPAGSQQALQNGKGAGKQRVQVGESDVRFRSHACQPWVKSS